MKKTIITAFAAVLIIGATPAAAGQMTLKKAGVAYSLKCSNAGCFLTEKVGLFKKGKKQKLGPGGSANFKRWRTKLMSQGYTK
ncbi:MAG: hypothetical protein AAF141_09840 [Pseudomonadota bacterium]